MFAGRVHNLTGPSRFLPGRSHREKTRHRAEQRPARRGRPGRGRSRRARRRGTFAPANGRLLFIGQSTQVSWNDYTSFAVAPAGGSVYHEVKSGTWVNNGHRDHATALAQQGRMIQVGVGWKDNPPGFPGGDENAKAAHSRAVTQEIADGRHAAQFTNLINFMNAYPQAKFFLRLDYEVSTFCHCTDASCASYKNAFTRLRSLINGAKAHDNVTYVLHPVRGEYEQLYPGDAAVDWIGVSVFAHELCMPIFDGGCHYNGTPPQNYDTGALQCRNAYIGKDANGAPRWTERQRQHRNQQSGKCLDADGWGTANGTQMIIWTCGSPVQSNQNWR